jgi:hypothetical protein
LDADAMFLRKKITESLNGVVMRVLQLFRSPFLTQSSIRRVRQLKGVAILGKNVSKNEAVPP